MRRPSCSHVCPRASSGAGIFSHLEFVAICFTQGWDGIMFHPEVGWYHVSPRRVGWYHVSPKVGWYHVSPKGWMVQNPQKNDCISCVSASVASVYDSCADCNRSWVHRWSCFDVIELLLSGLFVAPVVSVILHGIYVFVCLWLVALVCAVGGECVWVVVAATE